MKYLISFILALILFGWSDDKTPDNNVIAPAAKDTALAALGLDSIQLPPGFHLSLFARVPNARSMTWGANGTLFVGNRDQDKVYAVVDPNKDGKADSVYIIDEKLKMPCGVAFRDGSLY